MWGRETKLKKGEYEVVGRLVGWIVLLSLRSLGRCVCALLHSCMYISMSNLLFAKAKNLCILLLGNKHCPALLYNVTLTYSHSLSAYLGIADNNIDKQL